jgi:peptidylprolyl isomerase
LARSRQRERELARRRYERRRLREQQLRARRRHRNTILGAAVGTLAVIVGLVFLVLSLTGGGSSHKVIAKGPAPCKAITPNPPAKGQPTIPPVSGPPPTALQIKDVTVGKGAVAKAGSALKVTYIGVACSTGKVFDASYLHGGTPFDVKPLGQASVIAGWNQGLVGVHAGGVRELIIPPALGYGAAGQAPIGPNETLIFLINVTSVT